ncbi:MAG: purine-binding chemotaxis protein CheW [Planctomycetia bacterium]|nr:purine-binding chemotaxis protein CheW [Planctomycetia bacterium]
MATDNPQSEKFDWNTIKQRFTRLMDAAAQRAELTEEQADAIMEDRARVLARVPAESPDSDEILEVMVIQLASERFAIETRFIHEVYRVGDITPIPGGPDFLVGVTNMRGAVLSVLDLRTFFGSPAEANPRPQIIVLGTDRPEFGILVDEVHEVTTLRIDEVAEVPGSVQGVSREYLRGVTRDAMLILNGDVLLADDRLYMDERG